MYCIVLWSPKFRVISNFNLSHRWNQHIYAGQLKYARARAVTGWNIALDWNFGPNMYTDFYDGSCPAGLECGCQYCTPFIFVDEFAGTYTKNVDFWTSGHYSRLFLLIDELKEAGDVISTGNHRNRQTLTNLNQKNE